MKDTLGLKSIFKGIEELEIITDLPRIKKFSQDFNWYSPILKEKLEDKFADIVLRPHTTNSLLKIVKIITDYEIPVTIRGSGTGNYGQCVPLDGGVVIDMCKYTGVTQITNDTITMRSGTKIVNIDTYAMSYHNRELRIIPSTYRSATIGGFFCGGSGGIGSLIYGLLAEPGNIENITLCTVENNPQIISLCGSEINGIQHAYGVNGIVMEMTVKTEKNKDWLEQIHTFNNAEAALDFCDQIIIELTDNIRELSFLEAPVGSTIKNLNQSFDEKVHLVVILVDASQDRRVNDISQLHGSKKIFKQYFSKVRVKGKTVIELTWNHTTLHAIKKDPSITYLQVGYGNLTEYRGKLKKIKENLGSEMIIHLEYTKNKGTFVVEGAPLIYFKSEERLNEIIKMHQSLDIGVNNPHVYTNHRIERINDDNYDKMIQYKKIFDPKNLMNSGKLILNDS